MALEELAEFFEVSEHGTAANYTPSGGSASSITVIFVTIIILKTLETLALRRNKQ